MLSNQAYFVSPSEDMYRLESITVGNSSTYYFIAASCYSVTGGWNDKYCSGPGPGSEKDQFTHLLTAEML